MTTTREIKQGYNGKWINYRLTTDHAASSYGQPVLVDDDGTAYGPADVISPESADGFFAAVRAIDAVRQAYGDVGLEPRRLGPLGQLGLPSPEEEALVRKFLLLAKQVGA